MNLPSRTWTQHPGIDNSSECDQRRCSFFGSFEVSKNKKKSYENDDNAIHNFNDSNEIT